MPAPLSFMAWLRPLIVGAAELGDGHVAAKLVEAELDNAVGHELQVIVRHGHAVLRGQQHRSAAFSQEAQEREHLLAKLENVGGEIAELRERVQKDAGRLLLADDGGDAAGDRLSLDLGWREDIVGLHFREIAGSRAEVKKMDAGEVHAQPCAIGAEMLFRLLQGDEQHAFAAGDPRAQEVHPQSGLAGAGAALQQIGAPGEQSAIEHFIQAGHTGGQSIEYGSLLHRHGVCAPSRRCGCSVNRRNFRRIGWVVRRLILEQERLTDSDAAPLLLG
jgi:hypothetical protein